MDNEHDGVHFHHITSHQRLKNLDHVDEIMCMIDTPIRMYMIRIIKTMWMWRRNYKQNHHAINKVNTLLGINVCKHAFGKSSFSIFIFHRMDM